MEVRMHFHLNPLPGGGDLFKCAGCFGPAPAAADEHGDTWCEPCRRRDEAFIEGQRDTLALTLSVTLARAQELLGEEGMRTLVERVLTGDEPAFEVRGL
jgi:hypothetical protein